MGIDPATLRQVAAQLQAGVVLNLYLPIAGKDKFHILIHADNDRSLAFIINSNPAPFILRDAERAPRHILMPKSLHAYLDHDSHIACDEAVGVACGPNLRVGTRKDLIAAIVAKKAQVIGTLNPSMFGQVLAAANGSKLIAERDAAIIISAFK